MHSYPLQSILRTYQAALLPLTASNTHKLVLIGPHIEATELLCSNYHGGLPDNILSPCSAFQSYVSSASCYIGVPLLDKQKKNKNTSPEIMFQEAIKAAKEADIAVVVLGIDPVHVFIGCACIPLSHCGSLSVSLSIYLYLVNIFLITVT